MVGYTGRLWASSARTAQLCSAAAAAAVVHKSWPSSVTEWKERLPQREELYQAVGLL